MRKGFCFALLIIIFLTGCSAAFEPAATETSIPSETVTNTVEPSNTPEPTETNTSVPTETLTATPEEVFIDQSAYGFTISYLANDQLRFDYEYYQGMVNFSYDDQVLMYVVGFIESPPSQDPDFVMTELLQRLFSDGSSYTPGEYSDWSIGERTWRVTDFTGLLNDEDFFGRAAVIIVSEEQFMFGLIMEFENPTDVMSPIVMESLETALAGVEFSPKEQWALIPCEVSTDPTYGFTKDNPVKVGGDFIGASRERAYLDALLGPYGEQITYERIGSEASDTSMSILDLYEIYGLGQVKTIYIDMYLYETPMAPVGFTCGSDFYMEPWE